MFVKYQHIERLGVQETENILDGITHVFYKIDGTNGSVWMEDGELKAGSRNRELSLENDNAGFYAYILQSDKYKKFFEQFPNHRLFGEWLVPHSLKTYREDAWRRFYVFDVMDANGKYIPYDHYHRELSEYGIDYIPPLAIGRNITNDNIYHMLEKAGQFLVEDGKGNGEGIVIKNYDWENKYGRQVWAKVIANEFKEIHHKEMGAPEINGTQLIEEKIIEEFFTDAFIDKEKAKLELEVDGWSSQLIPKLLGITFYEFLQEELHHVLKKYKNPTINFMLLNKLAINKVKKRIGL